MDYSLWLSHILVTEHFTVVYCFWCLPSCIMNNSLFDFHSTELLWCHVTGRCYINMKLSFTFGLLDFCQLNFAATKATVNKTLFAIFSITGYGNDEISPTSTTSWTCSWWKGAACCVQTGRISRKPVSYCLNLNGEFGCHLTENGCRAYFYITKIRGKMLHVLFHYMYLTGCWCLHCR